MPDPFKLRDYLLILSVGILIFYCACHLCQVVGSSRGALPHSGSEHYYFYDFFLDQSQFLLACRSLCRRNRLEVEKDDAGPIQCSLSQRVR